MQFVNLAWENDKDLTINNVRFVVTYDLHELISMNSSESCFVLGKSRPMVERFVDMGQQQKITKVFDMGIFKGGSVVLYDQIFPLEKIVAIDYYVEPVEALAKYISSRDKADFIKPYYHVNQADRQAMEEILSTEFPERDIDLIVDDASHFYKETREAFNIAFPYLKAGGLYVIEDWGWAHAPADASFDYQSPSGSPFGDTPALSNLLIELFMLAPGRPDLIQDIFVNISLIVVRKGEGELPHGKFNISDHYLLRGKRFEPWL